jgi:hypothetical protein
MPTDFELKSHDICLVRRKIRQVTLKWLVSYFVKPNTAPDRDVRSVHDEKALFDEFVLERDMEAEMAPYWYFSPNFHHLLYIIHCM